jgi:small subunit ribosomal protein S19e
MTRATDVPTSALLPRLAQELRGRPAIQPPTWAQFAKTGVSRQRAPAQPDWWYLRSASVLRKFYIRGPTGVARMATEYGGKRDRGSAPYHARSGSRSVVREIVQQLEHAGLVEPLKKRGRRLSADGQRLIATVARDTLKQLSEKQPELAKYL